MLRGRWLNKRANEKSFEVHFWSVALTFAIINSTIDNSKNGGEVMSSIDLVILGIVLEKPQSAYDIQKDVEYAGSVLYVPDRFSGCYSCGGGDPSD